MAVCNGNHIGRNKGRHVITLRFNNRQSGQRAGAVIFIQLRCALKKAGVKIENVTRIRFTARRTTQQQGHLTISNRLLGQIIINNQAVHAVIAEIFAHGATGKRCQELQRRRLRSGRGNDNGIFHSAVFFERLNQLRNSRALLADNDINTVKLVTVTAFVKRSLLVQNRVNRHGCFTGLAVTNDQLALATANGDQGVNRFNAGLHRLVNAFARHNARRFNVNQAALG